jgi:hypothetical protein
VNTQFKTVVSPGNLGYGHTIWLAIIRSESGASDRVINNQDVCLMDTNALGLEAMAKMPYSWAKEIHSVADIRSPTQPCSIKTQNLPVKVLLPRCLCQNASALQF